MLATLEVTSRASEEMASSQISFDLPNSFPKHVYEYGDRSSGEVHGVVLTKPHVVSLILDLAGYLSSKDLAPMCLLEPACGEGAFLVEAVQRLLESAKVHGRDLADLKRSIRAFDIDPHHVEATKEALVEVLLGWHFDEAEAQSLVSLWVNCGDYLLEEIDERFDFIVGNPPYVRIEQIAVELQEEYRRRFQSLYDRADLYVAFIERSLNLLSAKGLLSFICADRWILNKYGSALRRILSERFSIRCYVDLHRASPFESDVIAYPSIFVISPGTTSRVHVAALDTASEEECAAIVPILFGTSTEAPGVTSAVYESWFSGDEPWVISTPDNLLVLRELEKSFDLLESGGTKVRIGVATGNDKLFIVDGNVDIEPDRLVPLVMRADLDRGRIQGAGKFVINAFEEAGGLVDLNDYPRLARYLDSHSEEIQKRHVAQKNPNSWFRTIDRVYPALVKQPKLLIPDIAGSNEVAFDPGNFHPHHNLYYVTSDSWDMEVLGGLLSSRVALFFVWSYAVKMRGGYLRFQAQYLRRIRLPAPNSLSEQLAGKIRNAFRNRAFAELDELALEAYKLKKLPHFDFVDTRK